MQDRDRGTDIKIQRLWPRLEGKQLVTWQPLLPQRYMHTPPTAVLVYCLFRWETCMLGDDRTYITSTLRRINLKTQLREKTDISSSKDEDIVFNVWRETVWLLWRLSLSYNFSCWYFSCFFVSFYFLPDNNEKKAVNAVPPHWRRESNHNFMLTVGQQRYLVIIKTTFLVRLAVMAH